MNTIKKARYNTASYNYYSSNIELLQLLIFGLISRDDYTLMSKLLSEIEYAD